MSTPTIGQLIDRALTTSGLSQRALSDRTGIPQASISRIINDARQAKTTEIMLIADATGHTYQQLTGGGTSESQVQWAARATGGAGMDDMKRAILHFMDLDDYLADQAIPAAV